jgi:hypothetical protein
MSQTISVSGAGESDVITTDEAHSKVGIHEGHNLDNGRPVIEISTGGVNWMVAAILPVDGASHVWDLAIPNGVQVRVVMPAGATAASFTVEFF